MNIRRFQIPFLLFTLALFLSANAVAQPLTVKEIMREPSISGMRVSSERLSPDGKWVVYLWQAEGKNPRDLYLVPTSGGPASKILSPADLIKKKDETKKADPLEYGVVVTDDFVRSRRNQIGNLRWSPDSSKFLFTQSGDIYVLRLGETKPKRITKTQTAEFSARFLDNDRILYQQSGNLFSINTKDGTLTQISKEANRQKRVSVFGATVSKNGEMIAYISSDGSKQRPLFVPNYLPYYAKAPTVRRGWTKPKVFATKTDGSFEKSIEVKLPKQEGEAYIAGLRWLAGNKTLIVNRVDKTHKRRQIFVVSFVKDSKAHATMIWEETDDKWIGRISRTIEPNPVNARQFFFTSEKESGFNHLFLVNLSVGPKAAAGFEKAAYLPDNKQNRAPSRALADIKRLTHGNWEIGWARWSAKDRIIYSSTEQNAAERQFYHYLTSTDAIFKLGSGQKGMKSNPQIAEPGAAVSRFIYRFSQWNLPTEVFADSSCNVKCERTTPVKLSSTAPAAFLKRKWNVPKFTEFAARDGKKVPAKIYFPANFKNSRKYPMVIFVHGAGYLQNVINGWNNYYREFMFNQLLTRKGYVVLDIDYRGSAGYGRDWRTDVYDFLGGLDYTDHLDGIDFMVRQYNVDVNRIGVYGGSYGGFMAAMLVMRSPDKISAAAALRPVMDWKNYYAANPFYTSQRLGNPKTNPKGYERSSPISYADKLRKPLLILHGLLDDNVHAQDSIQLVEKLMRLDKTEHFELMLYPAERHTFQRSTSWEDEYERILALFEERLN